MESPEHVPKKAVCSATKMIVPSSVPYEGASKSGDDFSIPEEIAAVDNVEAKEEIDVLRRTSPVPCGVESEALTLRESMSHAFVRHLGGIVGTSAFPCVKFRFV